VKKILLTLLNLNIKIKLVILFVIVNLVYLSIILFQCHTNSFLLKDNKSLRGSFSEIDALKEKLDKLDVSPYPLVGGNIQQIKEKLDKGELQYLNQFTNTLPEDKESMWKSENLLKHGLVNYGWVYPEFTSPLELSETIVTAEYGKDTILLWDNEKKTVYSFTRDHSGTDMVNFKNKTVYSALPGKVVKVKYDDPYYGKCIYTIHNVNGKTYRCLYGHLSEIFVREGDILSQGDEIGIIGNTGFSLGEHLHFETQEILNGVWVSFNPFRNCILHKSLGQDNYPVYM